MTDKEVMQQALDDFINLKVEDGVDCVATILALRKALEQHEPEPVAWRTFDGEGGYEYRDYEMNENYDELWAQSNPKHKGWVEPLYKDPTPCQTCEALARTVMMDQTAHDKNKEWVGLTDEEYELMAEKRVTNYFFNTLDYAHDIEAKLKEKNT